MSARRTLTAWLPGVLVAVGCNIPPVATPPASCPTLGCPADSGVHFAAALNLSAAQVPELQLRLCHNGVCSTLQPTADSGSFVCPFFGPLTADCSISAPSGVQTLSVTFRGEMASWADGDVFAVRAALPGVAPAID